MIEFQYDEKTYRKISARVGAPVYATIFVTLAVAFGAVMAVVVSNWVEDEAGLVTILAGTIFFLLILGTFVAVMLVAIRKQLSKSFAMYSTNGMLIQRAEVTQEEIVITNVSRQNVTRINRRDIASVKNYKNFFVVVTNTKVKWAVPFNEQTRLLYDVLTGKASIQDLPAKPNSEEEVVTVEQSKVQSDVQPDIPSNSNTLSFEYELSEQQAINMVTKVLATRLRVAIGGIVFCSLFALGIIVAIFVDYFAGNEVPTSRVIFVLVFAVLDALFVIAYCSKNKSGRTSGSNYFSQQSKEGRCVLRLELYDQGIVSVNVLRDTRAYFRLSDMQRVRLFKDFFLVEFASKEILPVPLTDETKKLYDILNDAIRQPKK